MSVVYRPVLSQRPSLRWFCWLRMSQFQNVPVWPSVPPSFLAACLIPAAKTYGKESSTQQYSSFLGNFYVKIKQMRIHQVHNSRSGWGRHEPQRKRLLHNKELMHFKLLDTWAWNRSMLLLVNATAAVLARRLTAWRHIHKVTRRVNSGNASFFSQIGIITRKKLAMSSCFCIWLHGTMRQEALCWMCRFYFSLARASMFCWKYIKHWILSGIEL